MYAVHFFQALGKIDSKGEVNVKVKINRQVPKQTPMAEIELSEENVASIEQIVSNYYTVRSKLVWRKTSLWIYFTLASLLSFCSCLHR